MKLREFFKLIKNKLSILSCSLNKKDSYNELDPI